MTPITENWLKAAGFKWHKLDRQPDKHWLLWLGDALGGRMTCREDLGIELAPWWDRPRDAESGTPPDNWFCWLRADCAGRYHRFIHVRHIKTTAELVTLIVALTGQAWDTGNNWYGSMVTPERAAHLRQEAERLDRKLSLGASPFAKWSETEKDDTRGGALPEHLEAHAKARSGEP